MSRLSNLNTLRIGIFGNWFSSWYENEYYSFLVFKDYKLIEYLNSIFYRLRLPTTHFYINRINQKYYYIESNVYITKPVLKRATKSIHKNKEVFKYLSIIEYLFDIVLLLPKDLIAEKKVNFISVLNNFNSLKYYLFYSLHYLNNLFCTNNLFFIFFNSFYFLDFLVKIRKKYNNLISIKNILSYNKLLDNKNLNNNLVFSNIEVLIKNEQVETNYNFSNNIIYLIFSNFLKIDNLQKVKFFKFKKKINAITKKKNKINIYFLKFISFFYNKKNWFFLLLNINFLKFFDQVKNFIFLFIYKFINIFFTSYFLNIKNKIYLSFIFFKFEYLLLKLNSIINKYNILLNFKLYIKNNLKFNFLNNKLYNSFFLPIESVVSNRLDFKFKSSDLSSSTNNQYYINNKFNKFIISLLLNKYGFFGNYYLKDFNILYRNTNTNIITIESDQVDVIYYKQINKFNNFFKRINILFNDIFFYNLNKLIEKTLYLFTGFECFFLPTYYINNFPLFDTKLLIDYISYNLKRRHNITKIFNKIGRLQKKLYLDSSKMLIPLFNELNTLNNSILNYKKYISLFNFNTIFTAASFSNIYNEQMKKKKNPISGIRIEFSGPPKKAERSKIIAYHDVIQDYRLIGKMPTHSIYADIHYYQSYIKLKRSTFGIKVWLFYNTRILNIHNINKTIL